MFGRYPLDIRATFARANNWTLRRKGQNRRGRKLLVTKGMERKEENKFGEKGGGECWAKLKEKEVVGSWHSFVGTFEGNPKEKSGGGIIAKVVKLSRVHMGGKARRRTRFGTFVKESHSSGDWRICCTIIGECAREFSKSKQNTEEKEEKMDTKGRREKRKRKDKKV
ncbi:hypothetical protein niasHT_021143 [Heterodera trifolii]|uniref:Uncharacterized protein n=1 Tax=Heterodera trifolii TaxID=157864 RepID=A0ABD2JF83_9BILA